MNAFFGGPPLAVIARLVVISLLVGFVLSAIGLSPFDIVDSFIRFFERIYDLGFDAIEWVFRYFLLGAVLVFPIWLVARVWKTFTKPEPRSTPSQRDA